MAAIPKINIPDFVSIWTPVAEAFRIFGEQCRKAADHTNDFMLMLRYIHGRVYFSPLVYSRVWEFPQSRFVVYEEKDEGWARWMHYGREVLIPGAAFIDGDLYLHDCYCGVEGVVSSIPRMARFNQWSDWASYFENQRLSISVEGDGRFSVLFQGVSLGVDPIEVAGDWSRPCPHI